MNEIVALAGKDLRLLVRDKAGFFFTFFFPILYAVFFGAIMSGFADDDGPSGIAVAVIDEDQTEQSADFVSDLDALDALSVTTLSLSEAQDRVRRGNLAAYVVLPPGFGESRTGFLFGEPPTLQVGIDPARGAEAAMIKGMLTKSLFEGIQDAFTNPDVMNRRIDEALAEIEAADDIDPVTRMALTTFLPAFRSFMNSMPQTELAEGAGFQGPQFEDVDVARQRFGPSNPYEISYPQGIVWGIMGCAAGFGISLVVERTRGTLVRLRMAPISRAQILAGKGLACLVATLLVAVILLTLAALAFDVRPNSWLKLALAIVSVAIGFVGIMMLLSVLGKTEQSAGGIGWAVLLVFAMIGGGMIPLAFLPDWIQQLASVSPIKWSILAMEGAIWRDFSYGEMLTPCGILLGIGVVGFALGARAFRWTAG